MARILTAAPPWQIANLRSRTCWHAVGYTIADVILILEHSQSVSTLLAESLNLQMHVRRKRSVRSFRIPTEFLADHIEKCAPAYVLTLHPRRQDIRRR